MVLSGVGGFTNEFVVSHNHGTMPVWVINDDMEAALIFDERHSALDKNSQYKVLCDIFVVPEVTSKGIEYEAIMSLGDLFIFGGQSLLCIAQILLFVWIPFVGIRKSFLWLKDKISIELK